MNGMRVISRKITLLLILVLMCALTWEVKDAKAENYNPLLQVSEKNVYLTAGQENQIEIKLKNVGSYDIYDVEALLSVPGTTTGISILSGAHKIFNVIRDGSTKTYNPNIYVDKHTPLGTYTLNLQVNYVKKYKLGTLQPESAIVQLGIVINNVTKPQIRMNVETENSKISIGSEEALPIRVMNIGEELVYDVDVTVSSTSPYIAAVERSRLTHDVLVPGEDVLFNPTLAVSKNTPLGVYTLMATMSYENSEGQEYLESFTLGINVDSVEVADQTTLVLQRYETEPETIKPGDDFILRLKFGCLGARAYDVKTLLFLDPSTGISPLSPTMLTLGRIEPGEVIEASYRLIVDGALRAGQYPATITLNYFDVYGETTSIVETVSFSIRGIIKFNLINTDQISAERGGITEIDSDLLLIGTESVQFVTVEVVEDSNFRKTLDSDEYIGAVDPDSPIPFDLEFKTAEDADLGDSIMTLKITYLDDLNQEYERLIKLPVSIGESTNNNVSKGSAWSFWLWLRRLLGLLP